MTRRLMQALEALRTDIAWAEEYCKEHPTCQTWRLERLIQSRLRFAYAIYSLEDVNTLIYALEESDSKIIQE
jgi:hypothetical protein